MATSSRQLPRSGGVVNLWAPGCHHTTIRLFSMCCSWLVSFPCRALVMLFMACCAAYFSTSTKPSHAVAKRLAVDVLVVWSSDSWIFCFLAVPKSVFLLLSHMSWIKAAIQRFCFLWIWFVAVGASLRRWMNDFLLYVCVCVLAVMHVGTDT